MIVIEERNSAALGFDDVSLVIAPPQTLGMVSPASLRDVDELHGRSGGDEAATEARVGDSISRAEL